MILVPTMTKVNPVISGNSIGAVARIEQLRRLIRKRRFTKDNATQIRLHAERDKYIETAVFLAKRAKYSEARMYRLAQEVNRSFDPYFSPSVVHKLTEDMIEKNTSKVDIDAFMFDFDVTREEYEVMLGTNS